jgi:RNA polymerase sigma-70 factor (ECF subfamily)
MADDLAQETFIKAFYALPKFRRESAFGTWLYRITVNKARDYFRKKARMSKMSVENLGEGPHVEEDEIRRKEEELDQEQRRKLVYQCLQALPQKHRVILTLRDIQGLSYEKIADILSISPGTVDSRLYRARKTLRKKITPFLSKKGGSHEL